MLDFLAAHGCDGGTMVAWETSIRLTFHWPAKETFLDIDLGPRRGFTASTQVGSRGSRRSTYQVEDAYLFVMRYLTSFTPD